MAETRKTPADLRAAIAGLGFMGTTHIEALRRADIEVVGCLGASTEETESCAEKHGLAKCYDSLEELVADPDVDVVHVCTPNFLHYDQCKTSLEAGKHVVCEKPLATSVQEASELAQLAAEKNLVGAVNYNLRFYPLNFDARTRIQSGAIGDVRLIHGYYLQDWLFHKTDWNWRLESELGGELRAVADIGTHWFDLVLWLTGAKIMAVMADFATVLPTRLKPTEEVATFGSKLARSDALEEVAIETEDYATIMVRFDNGARGVVTLSQVSAGHKNQMVWEIDGSTASLRWQGENPNELWIGQRDDPNMLVTKDPALMSESSRHVAGYPGGHAEGYPDTFKQSFVNIYNAITQADPDMPPAFATFEEGAHELVLCEAIQRSAREGRWIEL